MRAELARIKGDFAKAQDLYDVAIERARATEYINVLGMANELAMKFYLLRKMERAAKVYSFDSNNYLLAVEYSIIFCTDLLQGS